MRSYFVNIPLPLSRCATPRANKCATRQIQGHNATNTIPHPILAQEVPPLRGSINAYSSINPGLAPWAMKKYRPVGAHCPTAPIPQYHKQYNHNHTKTQTNATIHLHIQTHFTNTISRHNTANAQYDKEPYKGDTPAKPRVK